MFYSLSRLIRQVRRRKELGITLLLVLIAVAIGGNTLSFYLFESEANPDITVWDSIWYSVISVTTIGYGDFSAESLGARIGTAVFIVLIGLATFTTALGMAVDWVADIRHKERKGMGRVNARDHLVMVNFPNEERSSRSSGSTGGTPTTGTSTSCSSTTMSRSCPSTSRMSRSYEDGPLTRIRTGARTWSTPGRSWFSARATRTRRSDSLVASIAFVIHQGQPRREGNRGVSWTPATRSCSTRRPT